MYWLLTNTVSLLWRGVPMESKLPAVAGMTPSRFGTRNLEIASRRWPATRAGKFFFQVICSLLLLICVLTFCVTVWCRWHGAPMESNLLAAVVTAPLRFGTRNLEIASRRWPGSRNGKIFQFFSLYLCWFVCWLLAISGISGCIQWRGVPMESKLPAAARAAPSRFGTRNLEIASRRWPATRASTFFPRVLSLCLCVSCADLSNHSVNSIAFSPDGKLVASSSDDKTVKIWDISTGHCDSTLTGHRYAPPPLSSCRTRLCHVLLWCCK